MSEEEKRYTSYNEYKAADAMSELSPEDQELAAKIEKRRILNRRDRKRKKRRMIVGMILVFVFLLTMCGREIVRLKAENLALKKQHEELEEQRDRLAKELAIVGNKEYVKDQARRQLRLLDPGELMFIFDEGETEAETSADEETSVTEEERDRLKQGFEESTEAVDKIAYKSVKETKKEIKKAKKAEKKAKKEAEKKAKKEAKEKAEREAAEKEAAEKAAAEKEDAEKSEEVKNE